MGGFAVARCRESQSAFWTARAYRQSGRIAEDAEVWPLPRRGCALSPSAVSVAKRTEEPGKHLGHAGMPCS